MKLFVIPALISAVFGVRDEGRRDNSLRLARENPDSSRKFKVGIEDSVASAANSVGNVAYESTIGVADKVAYNVVNTGGRVGKRVADKASRDYKAASESIYNAASYVSGGFFDFFRDSSVDPGQEVMKVNDVRQWTLVTRDSFEDQKSVQGWNLDTVTQCGGIHMLGGYKAFSHGRLVKTFRGLPNDHTQIKIVATLHFIDAWAGESVLFKVENSLDQSMMNVFSSRHTQASKEGVNICGASTPEGKFAVPVEVFADHKGSTVKLEIQTTLDEYVSPDDASLGISHVDIYVR